MGDVPADFWMKLQTAYELDLARKESGKALQRIPRRGPRFDGLHIATVVLIGVRLMKLEGPESLDTSILIR